MARRRWEAGASTARRGQAAVEAVEAWREEGADEEVEPAAERNGGGGEAGRGRRWGARGT